MKKILLLVALSLVSLGSGVLADNPLHVTTLYVFGDSLSDNGVQDNNPNVKAIVGKQPTWSTKGGQIWTTYIAQMLGISAPVANNADFEGTQAYVTKTLTIGTDYAAGGARVDGEGYDSIPGVYSPPSLVTYGAVHEGQVDYYLRTHGGNADPNGLYVIWAGANDIFQEINVIIGQILVTKQVPNLAQVKQDFAGTDLAIGQSVAQAVTELYNAGAQHIVVVDLPNLAVVPQFLNIADNPLIPADMKPVVQAFVPTLLSALQDISGSGIQTVYNQLLPSYVIPADVYNALTDAYNSVVLNHQPYTYPGTTVALTNVTNPICLDDAGKVVDALVCTQTGKDPQTGIDNGFLFSDDVHPTDLGQQMMAHIIYDALPAALK